MISIVYTALYFVWFLYITDLERPQCNCSKDWKRTFIKYFSLYMIVHNLLFISNTDLLLSLRAYIDPIQAVLFVAYIYCMYFYVRQLKEENCDCSKNLKRLLMEIFAYLMIGFHMIALSSYLFIFGRVMYTKSK